MTDWTKLAERFPEDEVEERQGPKKHDGQCDKQYGVCRLPHKMLSYVDARTVCNRLDSVLTPAGWNFTWTHIPGEVIVHGRLDIGGVVREDAGYPNSNDDAEPLKSAVSDALKRCAVLFGIGRHLYDDNHAGGQRGAAPSRPAPRPVPIRADAIVEPDDEALEELHGRPDHLIHCPECGEPWKGEPGDLWHRTPEGTFHRHPDNIRKPRAAGRR